MGMNYLEAEARDPTMKRNVGGWKRQPIAVMGRNAQRRESIDIQLPLSVSRITRRENEHAVAEAAQMVSELLDRNCKAIQERGGVAGKETDGHRRPGCEVRGAKS